MQVLYELYQQNPFWLWLAVSAVFVGLDIALGWGRLVWAGAAAAVLALLNLVHIHLGQTLEPIVFVVAGVAGVAITFLPKTGEAPSPAKRPRPPMEPEPDYEAMGAANEQAGPGRLIGRVARTTSAFANGVGRVWVDGAEWSAELDGDEVLPAETLVRILGVTGGVKLKVCVA